MPLHGISKTTGKRVNTVRNEGGRQTEIYFAGANPVAADHLVRLAAKSLPLFGKQVIPEMG